MIDLAKKTLIEGGYSAVVVKDNKVLHAVMGSGVYPVIKLYNEYPEDMKDAVVADKIIGRAAAIVYILCGIKEIYCHVISEPGIEILDKHGIKHSQNNIVARIDNRTKTDMCPMEKSSFKSEDIHEAYAAMIEFGKSVNRL